MSEKRLAEVRQGLYERSESVGEIPAGLKGLVGKRSEDVNIGLANISRRLRLNFGEEARLEIRSKEEYYTVVELHVPFRRNGEGGL